MFIPEGSGEAAGILSKLKDGEHATCYPHLLPKGSASSTNPHLSCGKSGVNFKNEKENKAKGVFCCKDFPPAVNKSPCKAVLSHGGIYTHHNPNPNPNSKPNLTLILIGGMYKRSNAQFFGFMKVELGLGQNTLSQFDQFPFEITLQFVQVKNRYSILTLTQTLITVCASLKSVFDPFPHSARGRVWISKIRRHAM